MKSDDCSGVVFFEYFLFLSLPFLLFYFLLFFNLKRPQIDTNPDRRVLFTISIAVIWIQQSLRCLRLSNRNRLRVPPYLQFLLSGYLQFLLGNGINYYTDR